MLWCIIPELSLCIGLILIILYGLFSLSMASSDSGLSPQSNAVTLNNTGLSHHPVSSVAFQGNTKMVNLFLSDVYFFCRVWPLMLLLGYGIDCNFTTLNMDALAYPYNNGIDILLIILTVVILQSFKSFESVLLLLLAFVGQLFMLHSCDLVSFYICLEAQNFCFLVLCGLQPRIVKHTTTRGSRPLAGVEASIKYLLLSAFSSGVLLFWFSALYLRTGITTLSWGPLTSTPFASNPLGIGELSGFTSNQGISTTEMLDANLHNFMDVIPQMLILIALMFKLGGAPLHLWMVDIYSGVKRQLLMYLSTAPKLSLFGFWVSTWHSVWTDFTVLLFVALSMIIGCFGAYNQPTLRSLFAYSTINEIGLMLMAIETAGFHSLFQHLSIYIVTMLLLWNNSDKRLFAILAVSLAGMPPLAGFFGKAWIFNSVATGAVAGPYLGVLLISLFCTGLSLVYYLRVFRLFSMGTQNSSFVNRVAGVDGNAGLTHNMGIETRTHSAYSLDLNIKLTSFCVIFLFFAPLFYIKPFVL
jgi:NADH:ubiquinone oxidoreductase subunit 2 (subunit N)